MKTEYTSLRLFLESPWYGVIHFQDNEHEIIHVYLQSQRNSGYTIKVVDSIRHSAILVDQGDILSDFS